MEITTLKEQNVIKLLLTVTFFGLSFNLYSQIEIVGRYSSLMPNQEYYNYFDFDENGVFEYHSGAELGDDEFARGSYFIKNDSLFLNYDLTDLKYRSYHKKKEYFNSKDSISINIKVKDFKENPIKNTNVFIAKEKIGYIVDDMGHLAFNLKKEKKDFILAISNLGYESYDLSLSRDKNYEIQVFLSCNSNNSKAIKHEVKKYKILALTEGYLKLKQGVQIIKLKKLH